MKEKNKHGFRFERLQDSAFEGLECEWGRIHSAAGQSVFTSWDWMHTWWNTFQEPGCELHIVTAYHGDKLVGIAPFYLTHRAFLKIFSLKCLVFLGDKISGERGFRSEYLDLILDPEYAESLREVFCEYLAESSGCDELVLSDMPCGVVAKDLFRQSSGRFYAREVVRSKTYQIDTSESFESFSRGLGKGTRARVVGSRRRLEVFSNYEVREFDGEDLQCHLSVIKSLYDGRWGRGLNFDAFHLFLSGLLGVRSSEGRIAGVGFSGSVLELEGEVVAASLNLVFEGVAYNVLLGFREDAPKRVSLGLATLGYDIESACKDARLKSFDLLAGTGKKTNYKAAIASEGEELVSRAVYFSVIPRLVYRFYDRFVRR